MSIKVYAADSLLDLFAVINDWNRQRLEVTNISLEDLTLMKNHIEDLELELFGENNDKEHQLCKG